VRLDADQARTLFASAAVARLATIGPDGAPHLVPICFAVAQDIIYTAVDGKPKRTPDLARLANIAADPRVALLADRYDDDWTKLWWVRVDGDARLVTTEDERELALRALAKAYPQYALAPPRGPVIAVEPRRFSGWTAVAAPGRP
jgi:PPOX class probable F420-dependent enzyme